MIMRRGGPMEDTAIDEWSVIDYTEPPEKRGGSTEDTAVDKWSFGDFTGGGN